MYTGPWIVKGKFLPAFRSSCVVTKGAKNVHRFQFLDVYEYFFPVMLNFYLFPQYT